MQRNFPRNGKSASGLKKTEKSPVTQEVGGESVTTESSIVQEAVKLKDLFNLACVQIPGPAEGRVLIISSDLSRLEVNWI